MSFKEKLDLNEFTLQEKIGSGSFSAVYKVKENNTGNIYAAKISFRPIEEDSIESIHNLSREVNTLSKIRHPSILGFIGFSPNNFNNDPNPVIITEYLSNGTLLDIILLERQSLAKDEWNDTRKLINIYGIASAMSYLHLHKIIHRDLKPANILMDDFLFPKIADFGLSKILHTNQESMSNNSFFQQKGTPLYMSPEIYKDCEYSFASDVYAFGVIVYEIVTSTEPFKNANACTIMLKVINGERPEIDETVNDSYRNLIERCWAQNPLDRPSFDEIVEYLKTDEGLITSTIEKEDFFNYVDFIDNYKTSFDSTRCIISIDEFIKRKSKTFKRFKIVEESDEEPTDESEAIDSLKKAADNGDCDSIISYAQMLIKGDEVEVNKSEAAYYLKMAIDKGNVDAMYNYATMLYNGNGIPINKIEAAKYYKMSADKGDIYAMNNYANMLYNGDGIPTSKIEAAKYCKMSADKGNVDAMNNYAIMLKKGDGIPINKVEAAKYYKMSADKGDIYAMNNYAIMLQNGDGIPINKIEAAKYYKMSADKGNEKAMNNYANMLQNGDGIPTNKVEAAKYYKMSADEGNVYAMNNYTIMLYNGDGISINKIEAARYCKMSADKGNIDAMNNYAIMLYNGDGIPINKTEAAKYYKMSADKGNEIAMNNYASMLQKGDGIPINKIEAAKYYKMSADKGNVDAMNNYAAMLYDEDDIPTNKIEETEN